MSRTSASVRTRGAIATEKYRKRRALNLSAEDAAKEREARCKYYREYYAKHREHLKSLSNRRRVQKGAEIWDQRMRKQYGLSTADMEELLARQSGRCPICNMALSIAGRTVHVDHDHDTGAIRGLLCHKCNPGLGFFDDSPSRLKKAAEYLSSH